MYSLIVYFLISCISIIYSFYLFINYLRIYYLLYYSFIRIYYLVYYSLIRILLFIYTYFTIHLFVFYYSLLTIHFLPFTIYLLLFNIYYLLLTICYLGKKSIPYGVSPNSKILVPIRSSRCVDQFDLLLRPILTGRKP